MMRAANENRSASGLIDKRIADLGDWRGETLSKMRKLIHDADPAVVEEVKWKKRSNSMLGLPVWSHDGILCTGEIYKGASLKDTGKLFNSSPDGNTRRAIDIREGEKVDPRAFKALVRAAVELTTVQEKRKRGR